MKFSHILTSRLILVLMAIGVIVFTYMKIVDPKDFVGLATMVFIFYFGKQNATQSGPQMMSQEKSGVQINSDLP